MALGIPVTSPLHPAEHGAYHRYSDLPRPPPSPPMEEYKCSLPSISNLLGLADAGSPSSDASGHSRRSSPRPGVMPSTLGQSEQDGQLAAGPRSSSSSSSPYSRGSAQCKTLPPTPPMMTDPSFDGHYLLSGKPPAQLPRSCAPTSRYCERTPPLERDAGHRHRHENDHQHMQHQHPQHTQHPHHLHHPQETAPTTPRTVMQRSYMHSAAAGAPLPPPGQMPGLRYQRPLPQSFPPPPVPVTVAPPSGGFVWQHHHYLSPSHGVPFPPTQDRYICQTCNKAFSRPSSLRIHSHSHTGEKPFQCPHVGCGKAFSVRSNMKRHERGCHGLELGKGPLLLT